MGGPDKVGGSVFSPGGVKPFDLEGQIMNELLVPVRHGDSKAAKKRYEEVQEIFENISPSDAKALFARLKTENRKDPLSKQFYKTFSDSKAGTLVDVLEARSTEKAENSKPQMLTKGHGYDGMKWSSPVFAPQMTVKQQASRSAAQKGEIAMEGNARRAQLQEQGKLAHPKLEPPIPQRYHVLRNEWASKEASELNKIIPRDPKVVEEWLSDKTMPTDLRAKVLGVALLRGGSYPAKTLHLTKEMLHGDTGQEANLKLRYQKMAVNAALNGEPELFKELSAEDGGEHLPSHRRPATQLMHILLQDDGVKGDFKGQNEVQAWIEKLPSDVAGRAMYHMYDAARSKDYGGSFRITGIGIEVGNKAASVGFSFQGEYNHTHWAEVTQNISDGVGDVFGQRSHEEKRLIYDGFVQANSSFGSVILDEDSTQAPAK